MAATSIPWEARPPNVWFGALIRKQLQGEAQTVSQSVSSPILNPTFPFLSLSDATTTTRGFDLSLLMLFMNSEGMVRERLEPLREEDPFANRGKSGREGVGEQPSGGLGALRMGNCAHMSVHL